MFSWTLWIKLIKLLFKLGWNREYLLFYPSFENSIFYWKLTCE